MLRCVTPPTDTAVSIEDFKDAIRVTRTDLDRHIASLLWTAQQHFDGYFGVIGQALMTQTWEMTIIGFPSKIHIPLGPNVTVESISYVDTAGAAQVVPGGSYLVRQKTRCAEIRTRATAYWPAVDADEPDVTIRFTCGYGGALDVPAPIKTAINMLAGHLYLNSEATSDVRITTVPLGVDTLIAPYRYPI